MTKYKIDDKMDNTYLASKKSVPIRDDGVTCVLLNLNCWTYHHIRVWPFHDASQLPFQKDSLIFLGVVHQVIVYVFWYLVAFDGASFSLLFLFLFLTSSTCY
jgi:hypothetical protein